MKDKNPEKVASMTEAITTYDAYLKAFFNAPKTSEPNFGRSPGTELAQFAIKQLSKKSKTS